MAAAIVFEAQAFKVPAKLRVGRLAADEFDVVQIEVSGEEAVRAQPRRDLRDQAQLVADVAQAMHARDQIEGSSRSPVVSGGGLESQVFDALGRVKTFRRDRAQE